MDLFLWEHPGWVILPRLWVTYPTALGFSPGMFVQLFREFQSCSWTSHNGRVVSLCCPVSSEWSTPCCPTALRCHSSWDLLWPGLREGPAAIPCSVFHFSVPALQVSAMQGWAACPTCVLSLPRVVSPYSESCWHHWHMEWQLHWAAPQVSAAVLILKFLNYFAAKTVSFLLLFLFPGDVMIHSWEVWKTAPGFLNLCNSWQETWPTSEPLSPGWECVWDRAAAT